MRVVIDLHLLQQGAAPDREAALVQVRQLAAGAGPHTVLVLLDGRHPGIDELREALRPVLPASAILTCAAPAGAGPWHAHAGATLRTGLLDRLHADLLYLPGVPAAGAACPLPAGLPLALGLQAPPAAGAATLAARATLIAGRAADLEGIDTNATTLALPEIGAAARLWQAFAALPAPAPAPAPRRPRLAYVSPLPPEASGIADYSAEVLAELERCYDITLVVSPGTTPAAALARFAQIDCARFMDEGDGFDRIVYHFGNSNAHQHMFALLRRHPGAVVLHDFYLSGVLDNMESGGEYPDAFLGALYASHGYTGLQRHAAEGRHPAVWEYPCNLEVLRLATGVIVHSQYARTLATQWYGPGLADDWQVLPLLRGAVPVKRAAARRALGIAADRYLVCSFGMLGSTKLNEELLDAFLASPLADDPRCELVFAGGNETSPYGIALARRIAASAHAARIRVTGFIDAAGYAAWLGASDCAVQLRARTRGETSASVLDCLLNGLPTIVNAHGAAAELPDEVLVKLPDAFTPAELAAALGSLHADGTRRAALGAAARAHVQRVHSPAHVGALYHAALEHIAARSPLAAHRRLLVSLAAPGTPRPPRDADLVAAARALAANTPPAAPRQLLVDISALVQTDHKTGIQRVVRSVLLALIARPPAGVRVEPVYSEGGMHPYRYARRFTCAMVGGPAPQLEDAPIDAAAGDVFLGLDLASNITTQNEARLQELRRRGVRIQFVVYDLLPLLMPRAFVYGTEKYYGDYIHTLTRVADGITAISRSVADELAAWLERQPRARATSLALSWFHLGADLHASAPSTGLPPDAARTLAAVRAAPSVLMVGTLEPRKGQAQALDACELLWARAVEVNLVIVGKNGWLVDQLVKRLEQHPQRGTRLFWLPGVSDEMLEQLYAACAVLLAASEGEGFGLPLIEAAQHGLPIIARDIPVFREVAGEHAFYFDGGAPADLAGALEQWLAQHRAGTAPASRGLPWLTWQQSAAHLMDATLHGRVHRRVDGGAVAPQLLVDVSAVARDDLKTGIQRVVRAQLSELMRLPTTAFRVCPIYLTDEGERWHYRYARRYEHRLLGTDDYGVVDEEVQVGAGDVFYSPDFFPGAVTEAASCGLYREWRAAGVEVNFLVHDILPVLRPEFFPPGVERVFAAWLKAISHHADRLVCISAAVADETRQWLAQHRYPVPPLAVVHHGADIDASVPSTGLPDDAAAVLADMGSAPSFVMVGTIEPRKGHLQSLDAFEQLWAAGTDVRLVVVGGEGWTGQPDAQRRTIPAIMQRLAGHPELGRRLHWLRGISDEYLERVYQASACLLVPSEGEGFGLPLIEAARHGLPVLVRDLPVFREVAGDCATYFTGTDGAALAGALEHWLQAHQAGTVARGEMAWQTWADNARALAAILFPAPATRRERTA